MLAFVASMLLVLATGAKIYRNITDRLDTQYSCRTALGYIAAKIRQGDLAGGVALGELAGLQSLVLTEQVDGALYLTYIYYYNGYLVELFCSAEAALPPESGEPLLPLDGLTFSEDPALPGLYLVTCQGRDESYSQQVYLRSVPQQQ